MIKKSNQKRKNSIRRCVDAIAACAMMTAALPLAQISVSAADLISNGTFESSSSGWGMYKESGGAATLTTDNGRLALKVSSTGKVTYAVQMFYDIIPLHQNGVYRLKYDISSSVDRFVEGMIQQNGGTYAAYTWKGLNLTSEPQTVDYEFTMEYETDIMAKLVFNCGLQEKDGGELPEHVIYLDNVSLELVDDSKVDYSATRPYAPPILTDQTGYKTNSKKTAVFRNITNQTAFSVVNADTKQVVYTGTLSGPKENVSAGETDYTGDFSQVTESGSYYIQCDGLDDSYTFTIAENPYSSMLDDSVRMLYLQRCGCAVEDVDFAHSACHTGMATIYGTSEQIDVSGGWHDAGDYGRYTVAGAKAVADLLYSYLANPDLHSDAIGIPESGNGRADILDEAKYELDWMLKMQTANGGVYHKVTCENFPGYVAPEKETAPLIVTPVSTTATADFAGAMALAAEVYQKSDPGFAETCLNAAKNAWNFLEQNPSLIFKNPEDITTGEYGDVVDIDERYWAAAQLWRVTGDAKYLSALESMTTQTGMDWALVGDYGNIAILTKSGIDQNSEIYTKAKNAVIKQADKFLKTSQNSPYGVSQTVYNWGSNMTIANSGVILGIANQLTGNQDYQDAAEAQLHYLLGTNPIGTSFMTGYGTVSPQNPHHRPSMANGTAMKGMLVGGVNSHLEDSAAKAYCNGLAPALCYVDNAESYSTNEITIYWNSPLTYLLSVMDAETPGNPNPNPDPNPGTTDNPGTDAYLPGDANEDGEVDIADVVLMNRVYVGVDKVTPQGLKNADVDLDGKISLADSMNVLRYLVHLIDTLPVVEATPEPTNPTNPTEPEPTQPEPTPEPPATEPPATEPQEPGKIQDFGTPMNASASAVADFRNGETPLFFASDGWTNGSCFDCGWYADNTKIADGYLSLTIDQDKTGKY
ncbi:MAG: glycoside hydrolase family 9 protein, partial [Oscillospiraceae bacterium]|nr:glycoside hydrolase family 9 protein [Oscillospiraceae bacterium]